MKLRTKIILVAVIMMVIAISLCCILILNAAAKNEMDTILSSMSDEHKRLVSSLLSEINPHYSANESELVRRSRIKYLFSSAANHASSGSSYILTWGDESLYNKSSIDPSTIVGASRDLLKSEELHNEQKYTQVAQGEKQFLLISSDVTFYNNEAIDPYSVFLLKDITHIKEGQRTLIINCILISTGVLLVSAGILAFFCFRSFLPLKRLQKSAASIAEGNYRERVSYKGKDEIAQLGKSFNIMGEEVEGHISQLEATAEEQKMLLSALSHELKTPMTSIIGYSDSLLRVNLQEEERQEALLTINNECKRIERLSKKMMQIVFLQNNEDFLQLKEVSAKELFLAVEHILAPIAQSEGIALTFQSGDEVFRVDMDLTISVIINLFDNARKNGADQIWVRADKTVISVEDNGKGIPRDALPKVKQPFYMADKSRGVHKGSLGLGLTLCTLIAKCHNAHLDIQSEEGKGTRVSLVF
ncbi:HAMP domain-containing histidine kinase [Clostridia bacterium OttesenSCG-928-F22]|nr:HAMP domain-containing histidine kinase [Clostridia bacterium OttesenSCG-928-F22]